MVRLGLFIYDHLGGRKVLPATRTVWLDRDPLGKGLKPGKAKAFVYSDCWVEDSRLVILNACDAADRGAAVMTHTRFLSARREGEGWQATIEDQSGQRNIRARALVNAAGPWVADVLGRVAGARQDRHVRLVKGSHIVVPRLFEGKHAFLLQNPDKRVVFAIPYETRFTLIGTTDEPWQDAPGRPEIDQDEIDYLCATIERYFEKPVAPADIVWAYSGIRPLYDDHAASASAVTRDYVLDLDDGQSRTPILSVFGGKITTYRKLAEHAMAKLAPYFDGAEPSWTAGAILPGGEFADGNFESYVSGLGASYSALPLSLLRRLARAYGTRANELLGRSSIPADLGENFGADLFAREIDYLMDHEWARDAQDILFRRSKLGLHVPHGTEHLIAAYMEERWGRAG